MAWTHDTTTSTTTTSPPLLATGSQDARVRLWKFTTTAISESSSADAQNTLNDGEEPELVPTNEDHELSDSDDDAMHEEEEEEGESRLDIRHNNFLTRVTLEALLVGHEEGITSVCWYRYSQPVYNQEHLLVSSSMDRSILLWTPDASDGIWTPLTRVGSAGGILGGSVGSSLLGYLSVALEPTRGLNMLGAAYGGSIHVWNLEGVEKYINSQQEGVIAPTDERVLSLYWKATPCITGHFSGVADLSWEASAGQYLLTASDDQTCRLWAPIRLVAADDEGSSIWLEVARPQVHGYNIAAVTSLSCPQHPHYLVSGADEKELRGFDATETSLRMLDAVTGSSLFTNDDTERVERAFIPSLGLSNKATAAEGAEEDAPDDSLSSNTNRLKLPLERDLGAVSLWPEVQKLFGHKTELYCVTSTLEAQSSYTTTSNTSDVLVASSCKARDAEAAAIRLWRAREGKSHQVLSEGGHKSTVATLAFSPDGMFLASSGKDRRLCLWKRGEDGQYSLAWAKDSAHKRIIWSIHFLPFGDLRILASGSRDGTVKIWSFVGTSDGVEATTISSLSPAFRVGGKPDSVTSLSFCPKPQSNGAALLALGLESGRLELWNVPTVNPLEGEAACSLNNAFAANLCHNATVTKLAWRPMGSVDSPLTLASCSMDHGCRLFDIEI